MADLDNRHRDLDGRISQKRGDTKLSTLRHEYPGLAAGKPGNTRLDTLRGQSGKSLTQMIRSAKRK